MIRLRWGVAGLALLGMLAGALLFFLPLGPKKIEDFGPGLSDAPHLAATAALLAALPTLAGTTEDVYDTACLTPAPRCFSSRLPTTTLLAEARSLLEVAGAKWLAQDECPDKPDQTVDTCEVLYDLGGAHIAVRAGALSLSAETGVTYVAFQDARPAPDAMPQGGPHPTAAARLPLGAWTGVNPYPASWQLSATCTEQTAAGCVQYQHLQTDGSPISSSLTGAVADAERSLTAGGYRVDDIHCNPATAIRLGFCTVAGARFRTVGGMDAVSADVRIRAQDDGHVTVLVIVSASSA